MSIPIRNAERLHVVAGERTFFVTSSTWGKCGLLQSARSAKLLINVLYHYREPLQYRLHEFVVMPNHVHLLITVGAEMTVEKAVELIKGGFAFRLDVNWGSALRFDRRDSRRFGSMSRRPTREYANIFMRIQ